MTSTKGAGGSCRYSYLWLAILFVTVLPGIVSATDVLQCYKCSVIVEKFLIANITVVTPLCSKFVESPEYMVKCPYSTMCRKTISILHLQNGVKQETITRGCAQQKNTTQIFRNRQWEEEHLVQEVYAEGCTEIKGNNLAGSRNIHCYCRGELCNYANILRLENQTFIVIFVFSALRLLYYHNQM